MKTARWEVYEAIDTERDYQDHLWGSQDAANPLTIGEFLLLLEEYVARARAEWSKEKKPEVKALDVVRKIAGIAVNCMEQHGAPCRDGSYLEPALDINMDEYWDDVSRFEADRGC